MKCLYLLLILVFITPSYANNTNLATHLQEISVTVRAEKKHSKAEGSGVIITRELKLTPDSNETKKVNFVWTAGHVVDNLRSVRSVIDSQGRDRKTIEFTEAQIVKELVEEGRKVGELTMDAVVIKYSDADNGQDLALLMVRKQNFVTASAKFYLEDKIIPIGTDLFHVGSLLGQPGANSMTSGIVSQVGRVRNLGSGTGVVFDQTTVTAFPGSSGGGVFLAEGDNAGQYIGMLTRGAGEGFNLVVPVRRLKKWCKEVDLMWALDDNIAPPPLSEIKQIKVEDSAMEANLPMSKEGYPVKFPFLIMKQTQKP